MNNKKQKQYKTERLQVFVGGLVIGGVVGFIAGVVVVMQIVVNNQ